MKSELWVGGYFIILIFILSIVGKEVYDVDPFFHYHKPDTEKYYYSLENQRSQNDGISKHFEYDAMITGTSMTANFCTSEMDSIFGTNSVKTPFSGASYKEINDNLKIALKYNPSLKTVVRCLDMSLFFSTSDSMRYDLGKYPIYLYDENPWNDVRYLFNKYIIFDCVYVMKKESRDENFKPGITSFDDYANWQDMFSYGRKAVYPEGANIKALDKKTYLTDKEKDIINKNIYDNVVSLAEKYPDVNFYYFFSPYSIAWWGQLVEEGEVYHQIEAEKYIIEQILAYDNIKLFSFNMRTDIITDLNNYENALHYAEWINSLILKWMNDGKYQLTIDNYRQYIEDELEFYTSYDYKSLNNQEDYESDFYAAALLNQELNGVEPIRLNDCFSSGDVGRKQYIYKDAQLENIELSQADVVDNQYNGVLGIICTNTLKRSVNDEDVSVFLKEREYIGLRFSVTNAGNYKYLVFYGKKNSGQGELSIDVYDDRTGEIVISFSKDYSELDEEWHQYVIDISNTENNFTVIMNGVYANCAGDEVSSYTFRDIAIY